MAKNHNRIRREISSKLTIMTPQRHHWRRSDVFALNFIYFTPYCRVTIADFEQKVFATSSCYKSLSTLEQNDVTVFIFNFELISHFVPVLLLLILNMYSIFGIDISYFSRFQIQIKSSCIVYFVLERISTQWNAYPIAFLSKEDMFITNFNANCNVNFFYLLYLLIDKINSYLLTRPIKATCKNSNS